MKRVNTIKGIREAYSLWNCLCRTCCDEDYQDKGAQCSTERCEGRTAGVSCGGR